MLRKKVESVRMMIVILACASGPVNAARPLYVDDVAPVDVGSYQLEAGLGYWDHPDSRHWDFPFSFRAGVVPRLDVGVGFGGQFEEQTETGGEAHRVSGVGDLAVSAKWNAIVDDGGLLPALSLVPMVKFPTADRGKKLGSGEIDYDLTWIASHSFAAGIGVHANVGYSWLAESGGEDVHDIVHYGVAVECQLNEGFQWVGEVFALQEVNGGSSTVVQFSTGFRLSIRDDLTFDVAIGSAMHGDAPDFAATTGLTWVYETMEVQNAR